MFTSCFDMIRMWDMAKQTKIAVTMCNFFFAFCLYLIQILMDGTQANTKQKTNNLSLILSLIVAHNYLLH